MIKIISKLISRFLTLNKLLYTQSMFLYLINIIGKFIILMSEQVPKPQNKNIRTFREKEHTLQQREQTQVKQNGDTNTSKKQKQERHYEKEQIPLEILNKSHNSSKRKRAKSLNPETEYARARLLNSIVDKIRQTKRSNLDTLGLTEQNMKQKINRLQILIKQSQHSRDASSRNEDHKQNQLDISQFLKNINDMPNDSAYSINQNSRNPEKISIQHIYNRQPNLSNKNNFPYGHSDSQPDLLNSNLAYDFTRKKQPTFSHFPINKTYVPQPQRGSPTSYDNSNNDSNSQLPQAKFESLKNFKKNSEGSNKPIYNPPQRHPYHSQPHEAHGHYSFIPNNGQYKPNNLFIKKNINIPTYRDSSILESINNQLSDRPKSNTQNVRFNYKSPDFNEINGRRIPTINLKAPKPLKSSTVSSNFGSSQFPKSSTIKQILPPNRVSINQVPQRVSSNTGLVSPRDSGSIPNRNTLGFSRYSRNQDKQDKNGQGCPLCGRNCNCPRVKV